MKHSEKKEHEKEKHKKKMKSGGMAHGEKGKHRMDKYARGGAAKFKDGGHVEKAASMTPTSPLSGAGKMKERPGMGSEKIDSMDD